MDKDVTLCVCVCVCVYMCVCVCIYIYIYMHILALKKYRNLAFAITWMYLEGIMLSEISQRQTLHSHLHIGSKKCQTHGNIE